MIVVFLQVNKPMKIFKFFLFLNTFITKCQKVCAYHIKTLGSRRIQYRKIIEIKKGYSYYRTSKPQQ